MITTIRNYVNGSPSSATGDDDQIVRFVYENGKRTKYWVDLYPASPSSPGTEDQVTVYTYGVTKGGSAGDSKIGSGSLLKQVAYPDSSGGTDVVTFAYNAQGQEIWRKDQAGNVMEATYDDSGRRIHERATTIVTGIDSTVRRISTAYDDHGRVSTVSSYDHATPGSGSVLNEVEMQYDDWGNLAIFKTDPDSAIGGSGIGPYEVEHAFARSVPSGGRHTLRRDYSLYPGDASVDFTYAGTGGLHDGNLSRVTQVDYQIGLNPRVTVAQYAYLGIGDLVGTELPEPGIYSRQYGSTAGVYPDRDRLNRTSRTRWTKTLSPTPIDFVDLAIAYDRNSNITTITDAVLGAGFDVKYAVDDLNRLIDADEGTIVSNAITNRTRRQEWTLDQVGNWQNVQLDLNGNGTFTGTGELDETRTHNLANEILTREPDSSPPPEFTFAHDAAGNMTDDGEEYAYEYDAWYRLVRIRNRSTTDLVAEYTYYGNGYRASSHTDTNLDGDVDGDDPVYYFAYDERWRIVATFRDDDTDPKERFLHHAAGMNGYGGSSYIDSVILRDRDADTDWDVESDGVLEERRYYCQSWRHDVVAIVTDDGKLAERAQYSAYGVPYGIPLGDVNGDGTVDGADLGDIYNNWGAGPVRYDLNLDGTVDAADGAIVTNEWGTTLGRGALSAIGNRRGYAGYEADFARDSIMHVRHRVYHAELGRWTRRDPLGYVDGANVYGYVGGRAVVAVDPVGLALIGIFEDLPLYGACGGYNCPARFMAKPICASGRGFFVQQIDRAAYCPLCPFLDMGDPWPVTSPLVFWEIIPVERSFNEWDISFVDTRGFVENPGRYGYDDVEGEIRYFCYDTVFARHSNALAGFQPGVRSMPTPPGFCDSAPFTTGFASFSWTQPVFWEDALPEHRGLRFDSRSLWECCECANQWESAQCSFSN